MEVLVLHSITGQRRPCRSFDGESSRSSQSSRISTDHIQHILERLQYRQTKDSTTKTYLSVWGQLNKFVISLDCRQHLSWEQKTALFGAYLVDSGVQSSTLKSYFSAIKFILKQDEYDWDDNSALLNSLVRGCKIENDKVKIRLPIQKGLLELLLFELERVYGNDNPQPYLECMYKAMFCLAYYGMFRVGELTLGPHTAKACNVHGGNKNKILVVLYTSKTHGEETGPQKIKISALTNSSVRTKYFFCPFKAVIRYMNTRGNYTADDEQFFVFADKSPVRPYHFRNTLRTLLDRLDLDSALYDVHSFRSGCTCDLWKFGYSIEKIKALGRWKSNAVYKYLKLTG